MVSVTRIGLIWVSLLTAKLVFAGPLLSDLKGHYQVSHSYCSNNFYNQWLSDFYQLETFEVTEDGFVEEHQFQVGGEDAEAAANVFSLKPAKASERFVFDQKYGADKNLESIWFSEKSGDTLNFRIEAFKKGAPRGGAVELLTYRFVPAVGPGYQAGFVLTRQYKTKIFNLNFVVSCRDQISKKN